MSEERTVGPDEELVDVGDAENGETPEVEIVSFGDGDDEMPGDAPTETAEVRLRGELAEAQDRYLRLRADFDNFRKRMQRENIERARMALAEPFRDLLPVVDNLERALTAEGSAEDLRGGVELIARQFAEVLRRSGLEEIPALGQPFDPQVHEAVAREEDAGVKVPTVVAELQRGYWLNERLLRPAMVKVAVPLDDRGGASTAGTGEDSEE